MSLFCSSQENWVAITVTEANPPRSKVSFGDVDIKALPRLADQLDVPGRVGADVVIGRAADLDMEIVQELAEGRELARRGQPEGAMHRDLGGAARRPALVTQLDRGGGQGLPDVVDPDPDARPPASTSPPGVTPAVTKLSAVIL